MYEKQKIVKAKKRGKMGKKYDYLPSSNASKKAANYPIFIVIKFTMLYVGSIILSSSLKNSPCLMLGLRQFSHLNCSFSHISSELIDKNQTHLFIKKKKKKKEPNAPRKSATQIKTIQCIIDSVNTYFLKTMLKIKVVNIVSKAILVWLGK